MTAVGNTPTPAPSPAEAATIARFGIFEAEERVEQVARAIAEAGWSDSTKHGLQYASFGTFMEHLARAAIAAYRAAQDGGAEETLRDALRVHHPIMRSETGPFSGCRCGQVKLGQDVIAHVIGHLRAALAPQAGEAGQ